MNKRPRTTHKAINHIVQSAEAARIGALYREKLAAKGFTFGTTVCDHDSVFPPQGMDGIEAMNISKQIWAEVNGISINENLRT